MENLLAAYNIKIEVLLEFYQQLNQEFEYEPGKTSSLGIIYWGKTELLQELPHACTVIMQSGISDICSLYDVVRTPAKIKKYTNAHKINEKLLRILTHDIKLWLPQRTELWNIPILKDHPDDIQKLEAAGIGDQIVFLSEGQKKAERLKLSKKINMDSETITEYIRVCDFFRMGGKMDAIRPILYYQMGYNTNEKWATASPIDIIHCFEAYLKENGLIGKYLVPFPKEVGNGIAWAKVHQKLFLVDY
jgi:hypothetical protein